MQLDELRVLAGRLDEMQMSGLWPDLVTTTAKAAAGISPSLHLTSYTSLLSSLNASYQIIVHFLIHPTPFRKKNIYSVIIQSSGGPVNATDLAVRVCVI